MKVSRYNFLFDADDGTHLAFNAMTGSLATLTEDEFRKARKILSDPDGFRPDSEDDRELKDKLLKGGFLLRDDLDEIALLKVRYWSARFDKKYLRLTILPTLRCNFRCTYCYEARQNVDMNEKIQKALVDFVSQRTRNRETLTINWYGGEPLLVLEKISWLQGELRRVCEENGGQCGMGGIVTNGYLLDRKTAQKLHDLNVETAQVTLDGPRDVHNKRRPLANGRGTFDRIMRNLADTVDLFKHVSVRVNTDKNNADRVADVFDIMEEYGLKGKASVYFGKVLSHTRACAGMADSCFGDHEYTDVEVRLAKIGLERGFEPSNYPRPKANYCEGDQVNSFVVGPKGFLYKCWSDPGNEDEAVGHVSDGVKHRMKGKNTYKWLSLDIFERAECRNCNLLPVCMGGCPYLGLQQDSTGKGVCESWRYHLLDMLKIYYAAVARRKEAQTAGKASESILS